MIKIQRTLISQIRAYSSAMKNIDLAGVFPPIVTPFNSNEEIDWVKLSENFQKWNKIPFKGYVIGGSNGENAYLSNAEKVKMVEKARELAGKDKLIIASSGCETTKGTIELSKAICDAGADALLVITPCAFKGKMTPEALTKYFTQVADSSPAPIILYNMPANTNVDIPSEVAIKMAEHPNVAGLKDSAGDITKLSLMVHKTKHLDFQILAGSAGHLFAAYMLGCVGGVCALANTLGNEVCDLHQLFHEGKFDAARELQYKLLTPNTAVTKSYGVAGLKRSMEWFGFYGGLPRSPLLALKQDENDKLKDIFKSEGFLV